MNLSKFTAILISLTLVLVLSYGCGQGSGKDEESDINAVVLKLASDAPVDHIATVLNEEAINKVRERTSGRVKIEYYPGSELGSYENVYGDVIMGNIDIAQITIPDDLDSRFGAAYLPYYATSFEDAEILYAPDSYISQVFVQLTEKNDVRFLGWVLEGFIGVGVVKEPENVTEPGFAKNITLRTSALATMQYAPEDLGYTPVTITYAEVPTALRTNVVDGWVGGTPNMNYAWVGDIINKFYVNYIFAEATCYVMSEKSLSQLSPEDQQIVTEVFKEQSIESFKLAKSNEELYKQKLEDEYGVEVVEFTDEEIAANAAFVRENTWKRLEPVLTPDLIKGFQKEVEKLETIKTGN